MLYEYNLNHCFSKNYEIFEQFLAQVFTEIVFPMTLQIKELMKKQHLVNEAEIFCADMKYRVEDE